jgi:NADH dehydrogenase FAD-containing subunit
MTSLRYCSPELFLQLPITSSIQDDLKNWYPELAGKIRITLVEALPSVLPMFSKQLIEYTESTFKKSKIEILTKTMVKEVKDQSVMLQMPDKNIVEVPCGMVIWAAVSLKSDLVFLTYAKADWISC